MNITQLIEQLDKQVKGFARKLKKEKINTLGYEKGFTPLYDIWIEVLKDYEDIILRTDKERLSLLLIKAVKFIRIRISYIRITVEKIRKIQTVIFYDPKRLITGEEDINRLAKSLKQGLEAMEEKLQTIEDSKNINDLLQESVLPTKSKGD